MHTVTFIDAANVIQTVSAPSKAAAVAAYVALLCAGYRARLWKHTAKNAPELVMLRR